MVGESENGALFVYTRGSERRGQGGTWPSFREYHDFGVPFYGD